MGLETIVPAVIGGFGLMQSDKQNKDANKLKKKGLKLSEQDAAFNLEIKNILKGLADSYNPKDTTRIAVDAASGVAAQTLEKALRKQNAGYSGGSPAGDTGYALSGQRAVNDAFDPLKAFVAQETANEPMRKADMYSRVLGVPSGQAADAYFKASAITPRADPSGSLSVLSQALERWLAKPGGAGGTGDAIKNAAGLANQGATGWWGG